MKAARIVVLFLGIVLLLVGLLAAGGTKFDVVKTCAATDQSYRVTWTGQVSDPAGAGLSMVGIPMYDYSDHMITPFEHATSQTGGYYFRQYSVDQSAAGRRYQVQTYKVGYDSAIAYVVLPCREELSEDIQHNLPGGYYVINIDFTLTKQTPLVAAFVYTYSYTTVDFFDRSSGGPDYWFWTFGDGTPKAGTTAGSIEHVYAQAGTYAVKLEITRSLDGKTSTAYANVSVSQQAPPGSPPPAPPPPPPPPPPTGNSTDYVPPPSSPPGGSSDVPPTSSTSFTTDVSSPNGPSPVQTIVSTVFSPSPLAAVLIIAGAVAILVALVSKGS